MSSDNSGKARKRKSHVAEFGLAKPDEEALSDENESGPGATVYTVADVSAYGLTSLALSIRTYRGAVTLVAFPPSW